MENHHTGPGLKRRRLACSDRTWIPVNTAPVAYRLARNSTTHRVYNNCNQNYRIPIAVTVLPKNIEGAKRGPRNHPLDPPRFPGTVNQRRVESH